VFWDEYFVTRQLHKTSKRVFLGQATEQVLSTLNHGGMMNKSELIEALAKEKDLPLRKAEEVVNTVFGEMENALINGERVEIRGLGSFKVKRYDGYKGRNPKTGEIINVGRKKLPFFKVGKELKERVDII
jgi:integration host factor subunit beta